MKIKNCPFCHSLLKNYTCQANGHWFSNCFPILIFRFSQEYIIFNFINKIINIKNEFGKPKYTLPWFEPDLDNINNSLKKINKIKAFL
jgi:hypothetical protein